MTSTDPQQGAQTTTTGLYSDLTLNHDNDIRLVKVRGGIETLSVRLSVANLDDTPRYTALSYTWGPATAQEASVEGITNRPSKTINCNGHPILITQNLYHFLRRASEDETLSANSLWIDNLCIDQSNEGERTNQVKLMSRIYHSAEQLFIWLGEEDRDTANSFNLMRCLAHLGDDDLKRVTPASIATPTTISLLSPYGAAEHWQSVRRFFANREYFQRIWIVQEVMLATRRTALCGRYSIDWNDIVKVSHLLTVTAWTRWLCPIGALANSHHNVPNLIEANKRTRESNSGVLLLYSLIRTRRFKSSDPRDKVYALLGLLGDTVHNKPRLDPVYGRRTVAETYTLATIQILEDSDDLLVLAHADGFRIQAEDPPLKGPSLKVVK